MEREARKVQEKEYASNTEEQFCLENATQEIDNRDNNLCMRNGTQSKQQPIQMDRLWGGVPQGDPNSDMIPEYV